MKKFWQTKELEQMTEDEWESICDQCGKCCLIKLQDQDSGQVFYTSVPCTLFDQKSCHCKDYTNREKRINDCVKLTTKNIKDLDWLPKTCSYVLIANKKDLPYWHHLITGDTRKMHALKKSVKNLIKPLQNRNRIEKYILDNDKIDL